MFIAILGQVVRLGSPTRPHQLSKPRKIMTAKQMSSQLATVLEDTPDKYKKWFPLRP